MTNTGNVPFVDLQTPHRELEAELVAAFKEALRTAGFIGGPSVDGFEREFADFCGRMTPTAARIPLTAPRTSLSSRP